jgi:hypothetical protein
MRVENYDAMASAFAEKDVRDMYYAITNVIRSAKLDSGASLFKRDLDKALNVYFGQKEVPELLAGVFSSLGDQAAFLVANTSSRRCETLAAMADMVMERGRLRPITVTNGCFRVDMFATSQPWYVCDESDAAAMRYRPRALRFCEAARTVLDTEVRDARTLHEKIRIVLEQHQGSPRFYVNCCLPQSTANAGSLACVVTGLGPLAVDALPLYTDIVVLLSDKNLRLGITLKYVDDFRNLHCATKMFADLKKVEPFHNRNIVVTQHDLENISAPRREGLESITWRQDMFKKGFARCLVGAPMEEDRPLRFGPASSLYRNCHTGLSNVRCKEDAVIAIAASVNNGDGLTILTGGPGSGKTSTAALFAASFVSPQRRILYMAPSNAAVDAAYLALEEAFGTYSERVVLVRACDRLGKKSVPTDPLDIRYRVLMRHIGLFRARSPHSFFAKLGPHQVAGLQRGVLDPGVRGLWQKSIRPALNTEATELVASARVVCCTVDMARSSSILRQGGAFDLVIGDEAGQASDAQLSLLATVPGVASGVLVGDDKQLGPFGDGNREGGTSPFMVLVERARAGHVGRCLNLTSVYRCHPFTVHIFNSLFYGGELQCGVSASERMPGPTAIYVNPNVDKPVLWMDQRSEERRVGTSFQSPGEASTVVLLLGALTGGRQGIDPRNICVLAPYVAQVQMLLQGVGDKFPGISILTIDSAQGATFDYVVLSLVRSNFRCDTGFVGDPRRLNVMLSRARLGLFIVGCHSTALGSRRRNGEANPLSTLAGICRYEGVVQSHLVPFWRARY